MSVIDRVLSRPEFADDPPVLVDIGASGRVHPKWAPIARHSICAAFDADDRELATVTTQSGDFRKLLLLNRAVIPLPRTDGAASAPTQEIEFYLTRSPFCSSTLPPDAAGLAPWRFAEYFEVQKVARLKAVGLRDALAEMGIHRVDWFKCDSQGTDLRLFQSMGDEVIDRVLVAEFEPGLIEAYRGEDDLAQVLSYMKAKPFWLSRLDVKGVLRIRPEAERRHFSAVERRYLTSFLRGSPGWTEMVFLNELAPADRFHKRDVLLAWVFAVIEGQFGFALELAESGLSRFGDSVFAELVDAARGRARTGGWLRLPGYAVRGVFRQMMKKAGVG